uniref:Uncharacterized protein n=1 Tax=Anguilla anguilla TaxID=7936 RepID=A0A0E9RZC1_ANGAN
MDLYERSAYFRTGEGEKRFQVCSI